MGLLVIVFLVSCFWVFLGVVFLDIVFGDCAGRKHLLSSILTWK